jgi:hypothetical protein
MDKLVIAEQTCLLEEKFSKNGVQKNVHVVVKNTPFTITLVLLDKQVNPMINFNNFTADVQLVYDCPTLKEVDFVKLKPMDFKLKPNEDGDQLSVEIRIKVLTSQLEDMFFRVRIALVDPQTMQEVSPLFTVLSHPIRVVSKPDQVKKKIKKRKRAPTDNLMDTLARIEAQQKEQQRLLKKLCVSPSNAGQTHGDVMQQDIADGFHTAFTEFLAAFTQLSSVDDNAFKVNTNAQDAQTMCEILDLIRAELKRTGYYRTPLPLSVSLSSSTSSSCSESPPHPAPLSLTLSPTSSTTSCGEGGDGGCGSGDGGCENGDGGCGGEGCKDKMDRGLESLEGELFSNVHMTVSGMVPINPHSCDIEHAIHSSFPFAPFHDLSTMFAAQ